VKPCHLVVLIVALLAPLAARAEQAAGANVAVSSDAKVQRAIALLGVSDPDALRNRSIPALYDLGRDDRLTALFRAVWKNDRAAFPALAWTTLERPDVRIAFAQFWGQYIRNTSGNAAEMADTRRYVEQYLHDPDMKVRADAVAYLGAMGTRDDVPALLAICSQDALPVAVNAAVALRILLDNRARGPLEECRSRNGNASVKDAVDSILVRLPH
jgi:hypothetical protein